MRIAVLDDYQDCALRMADWDSLRSEHQLQVFQDHLQQENAVVERLKNFEIVVAMRERTPFSRNMLKNLDRMRLLVTTGMRNASIDLQAATDYGIMVCGTDGLPYPPAELTWGLILALARHIPSEDRETREGRWQTTLGSGLNGKALGILGLGKLGSQVASIGKAFGMSILAWSQNLTAERAAQHGATLTSKDQLLSSSDFVTIHLVLSDRTRGLIGEREIGLMKPTAYLVNTSRGPIVDESALVNALERGIIAGAGLDVFDQEPLSVQHPFLRLRNTVITPHLGYVTAESYHLFFGQVVDDIQSYLRGSPVRMLNRVGIR